GQRPPPPAGGRPPPPPREIRHAAPDVDHRSPVDVDRARGADIATPLEVLDERADDGLEGRLCPSSDLDHLGARRARVRVHGPVSLGTSLVGSSRDPGPRSRDPGAFLRRDARLPQERRRLRQGDGLPEGRRPRAGALPGGGRARGRQHVRLRRSRPPGVHRRDPRARRGAQARRQAGRYGLPGRALRRRARDGPARGGRRRPGRWGGGGELAAAALKSKPAGVRDLLELPRPPPSAPWAYVKVAEGCDRACAFCAIPSFRGKQRSRSPEAIETEARALVERGAAELVLVAQDLAWYGRDAGEPGSLAPLLRRLDALAERGLARIRLLYLYPSEVRDPLVTTMLELPTVVPYFDLSLQHASAPLLRGVKPCGGGERFMDLVAGIRAREPDATFR